MIPKPLVPVRDRASAISQTNTSLHAVATAVEEMTATISEIARNSEKAHAIAALGKKLPS